MRAYKCLQKQLFEKDKYQIVPLRDEDKYCIMQWRNEQIYHLRQNKLLTIEDQESYFEKIVAKLFDQDRPIQILFSYLEDDVCIGYGGLVHINWIDKNAEISFIMNTALERYCFGFHWITYLSLIEQVAFKDLNLHKIFVFAFDLRPHLYQAIEKAAFKREAILKEHYYWDGRFIDAVIHTKINQYCLDVCLLASGKLGYDSLIRLAQTENLVAIFTDKGSERIIAFANQKQIPLFIGNPRAGKAQHFIESIACDVVLSINYLFIVEQDVISLPKKYAINLHGSLLPKYRGRTPHVWAIINNEKLTGITAHLISKAVDNGAILLQKQVPIEIEDTGATILEKYTKLYPTIIEEILSRVKTNSLVFTPQNEALATYFGKRTPADGEIDWDWDAERIRNWVRAQAKPYPGAFSWYGVRKMVIHKVQISDKTVDLTLPNGFILKKNTSELLIKVSNHLLILSEIEDFEDFQFQENKSLGQKKLSDVQNCE